jgi:hypothetical protein
MCWTVLQRLDPDLYKVDLTHMLEDVLRRPRTSLRSSWPMLGKVKPANATTS